MDRTRYQSYQPWRIGAFPKGWCDVRSLRDSSVGLEIDLMFSDLVSHHAQQTITVKFASTEVYRVADEGIRLLQLHHLYPYLPLTETIYIVSNSDMVDELVAESCEVLSKTDVVHYFIVTANDCVDVITRADIEPELTDSRQKPLITKAIVTDEKLIVDLVDGRSLTVPLDWYPRLSFASVEERQNWQLLGDGYAIEWPDLDEHIGIEGLLAGRSGEGQQLFDRWLSSRNSASL